MDAQQIDRKAEQLISRFDNGIDRYHNSAIFHQVINSLAREVDPIHIIGGLCEMVDELTAKAQESARLSGTPLRKG